MRIPSKRAFIPLLCHFCGLVGLLSLSVTVAEAQQKERHDNQKKGSTMHAAKWWTGFKTGLNYTQPSSVKSYYVFSSTAPVTPGNENYAKKYDRQWGHTGYQVGWPVGYAFTKNIGVFLQPTFANFKFGYQTRYGWSDSLSAIDVSQQHTHTLHTLELPLMLKLSLPFKKIQPYVQIGGFYGWLIDAKKSIETTNTETSTAGTQSFPGSEQITDVSALVSRSWKGIVGGAGISLDVDYVRIALECNYRYGLDNMTNPNRRFSDARLVSGAYDAPDDLKMRNLEFAVVCSMPLDNLIHLKKNGPQARPRRKIASPSF